MQTPVCETINTEEHIFLSQHDSKYKLKKSEVVYYLKKKHHLHIFRL